MINDENIAPQTNNLPAVKPEMRRRGMRLQPRKLNCPMEAEQPEAKRPCVESKVPERRRSARLMEKSLKQRPSTPISQMNQISISPNSKQTITQSKKRTRVQLTAGLSEEEQELLINPEADRNDGELEIMMIPLIYNIFGNLEEQEERIMKDVCKSNFLLGSRLDGTERTKLVDWMVGITSRLGVTNECLYMAVTIVDMMIVKFKKTYGRHNLQILAQGAIFIASKYEEIYPASAERIVRYGNHGRIQDVMTLETTILNGLGMKLVIPYPVTFLRRYSRICAADDITHNLAKYFCELSIVEYPLCHMYPSQKAASSLCAAHSLTWLQKNSPKEFKDDDVSCVVWNKILQYQSGYSFTVLKPYVGKILRIAIGHVVNQNSMNKRNIFRKYQGQEYFQTAVHSQFKSALTNQFVNWCDPVMAPPPPASSSRAPLGLSSSYNRSRKQ